MKHYTLAEREFFANFFEFLSKRKTKFEENNFIQLHPLFNKMKTT